ncbi:hypothetical protein NC652_017464 [Populus alba x Populus x berolinensis]|uniref:Uncharacterized protein n=1 Tax=Populus alba x Populus x berolinensis TaxID=444605 RepID=A0AAD6QQ27_9ROSI|nr:hypothetical protein NC652_017464 [Populus alba x Populus x berolinensis]KAJ6994514.1 hypothetical protein NC653_017355 [Populus alba x Populus x berolinensis]
MLGGFSGLMKEEGNVLEDDLEKVAVYNWGVIFVEISLIQFSNYAHISKPRLVPSSEVFDEEIRSHHRGQGS